MIDIVTLSGDSYDRAALLEKVSDDESAAPRPTAAAELKWIDDAPTERNLNKYGGLGYRLRVVGAGEGYSYGDFLFEKLADSTEKPEYAVVDVRDSTPQQALNEAASRGFRLLPHRDLTACCGGWSRLVMEKLAGVEFVQYRLVDVAALNTGASEVAADEAVAGVIRLRRRLWGKVIGTLIVLERSRLGSITR